MSNDDFYSTHRLGLKLKFAYSIVGLVLGLACIIGGVILGLSGVVGHTSWAASLLGFSTNISDAAPGVILFVVGIFMVLITRFRVKGREYGPPSASPRDSTPKAPQDPDPQTKRGEAAGVRGGSSPLGDGGIHVTPANQGAMRSIDYTTKNF
jgi:hypothetical protein